MDYLVNFTVNNGDEWEEVASNPNEFQHIAQRIFAENNLPFDGLEFLVKASNAVFLSGEFIIKIIIFVENDDYEKESFDTEVFGIKHCQKHGIPTVNLVASGQIHDKYIFNYLIMKKTVGSAFTDEFDTALNVQQKLKIGENLRALTDKMNIECENFNTRDFIEMTLYDEAWSAFSASFQADRSAFLLNIKNEKNLEKVFVHADINPQNLLCGEDLSLTIIDFADALLAPKNYEIPVIVMSLFNFDQYYIKGFFGETSYEKIAEACANSLLYHYYGHHLIKLNLGDINQINNIVVLKEKILAKLNNHSF